MTKRFDGKTIKTAPWWEFMAAKEWGQRVVKTDSGTTVTGHIWRKILYIESITP